MTLSTCSFQTACQ